MNKFLAMAFTLSWLLAQGASADMRDRGGNYGGGNGGGDHSSDGGGGNGGGGGIAGGGDHPQGGGGSWNGGGQPHSQGFGNVPRTYHRAGHNVGGAHFCAPNPGSPSTNSHSFWVD